MIEPIPEGWEKIQLKKLASNEEYSFIDGDWIESEHIIDKGIRIIQTGNIGIGKYIDNPNHKKFINCDSFEKLNCKKVLPDDLLICRLADPIGRTCIVPNHEKFYVTAVDVVILRVDSQKYDKRFVMHYLNDPSTLKKIGELAGGSTRQRISRTNLGNIELKLPTFEEQRKIASILETVDNNIDKTHEIIEKHEMMKKGLMHDLFIKGLDENQDPIKGWNFKKLIDLSVFIKDGTHGSFQDYENGIPMLSAKDIQYGEIILNNNPRTISFSDYKSIHSTYKIQKEDILLTIVGTIGRTAIVKTDEIFTLQRSVAIIRPKEWVNPPYLCYYMNSSSFQKSLELAVNASAQGGVYLGSLNKINVLIPEDVTIQIQIAENLKAIDKKIIVEKKYLNKLQKIKTGLMQDLLTGKVRVKT